MCGIAGLIVNNESTLELLQRVQTIQHHRGPDSQGIVEHKVAKWTVGLGHQRLSILDLTESGNQPMASEDGNAWITYNGEVYNYPDIRAELELLGHRFRGTSDTEVVLAALQQWGPEKALPKFNGMWAFCYLDKRNRRLVLARDRVGVKPLYYYFAGHKLYFASEIKAILEMIPGKVNLNYQVAGEYLLQSLLGIHQATFFEGIEEVPAAHYGEIDLTAPKIELCWKPYWTFPLDDTSCVSEKELITQVRDLFFDAVSIRLRSDVPLGVLLSGGLDSSAIAAVMRQLLGKDADLNIISAVSEDVRYCNDIRFNELRFIEIMSKHLGQPIQKVLIDLQPDRIFALLEQAAWFNDEPVGGFSSVSHYLLMQRARELGITVVLSGQGADELCCGYKKYLGFYLQTLVRKGEILKAADVFRAFWRNGTILSQFSIQEAKRYFPGFLKPSEVDIRGENLNGYLPAFIGMTKSMSLQERQVQDIRSFSVPTLVHYEDRLSMACSREVRLPYLDYRMIEKLVPLPPETKIRDGWTKYIFRKAMEPLLPPEITWRKDKQPFVNPLSEWLKNDLKARVCEYFAEDALIFKYRLVNRDNLLRRYRKYCQQPVGKGTISSEEIFHSLNMEIWLRQFQRYIS